ncbi:MAG: orotate phosphoribosyltransferase [Hyphomicrobiaceae bacterium]|nr:orotate phosphoribosyltransferase [Hyphomicrobiaceae bacterium]
MTRDEVLAVFRECGAILEGHFILSSGLRSPVFLQKARVFQYPAKTEILCKAMAAKVLAAGLGRIDAVIAPAVGGIVPGYETARHMNVPAMWVEREGGEFRLRRFELEPGSRVVVVEDIVTTGLSIRETIEALRKAGIEVVAACCLIDRSDGEADVGVPLIALTGYKVPAYKPEDVPADMAAIPAVKPGSRNLA